MVRSGLIYRDITPEAGGTKIILIAIHGDGGDIDQFTALAENRCSFMRLIIPQALRRLNPHGMGPEDGGGYTWFYQHHPEHPEPASFGDCLSQLEHLVYDINETQTDDLPLFVLGHNEGAVLALALAGMLPERIDGVIAIGGYLPEIRACPILADDLRKAAILMIHDPKDPIADKGRLDPDRRRLVSRGAEVELHRESGVYDDPSIVFQFVRSWLMRYLTVAIAN
jgi:predicted esterase